MKYFMFLILIVITSCNKTKKEDLELEIVTREINSLNVKTDDFFDYYIKDINPKSKTIVVYKLTNNSDKTYYFNLDGYNKELENDLRMDRVYVRFMDSNNKKIKTFGSEPTFISGAKLPNNLMLLEELNYNNIRKYKNFIIHPYETLYFEWLLVLPYGNKYEFKSYWVKDFNPNQKYFTELILYSNSKNYKKQISRTDLKTIQENGYEVYNGVIKSKNKIPVVFSEVSNK